MTKPVWLLDFDGVVNVVKREPPTNIWPEEDWRRTEQKLDNYTFQILYAQPVIDFLVKMSDKAEIRWHTTWKENILPLARRMGLPEFEIQKSALYVSDNFWWKSPPALKVVLEEERPLIWTDDDLNYMLDRADAKLLKASQPCLLLCTAEYHGLRKQDLELIQSSIEEFTAIDGDQ